MEWLVSRVNAGWQDAGACGKCWVWWEAPVSALEQDLSSQTTKEVVHKDRATEEGLRIVNESHLIQGETQHMGTLLQNGCNLKERLPLDPCNFFSVVIGIDQIHIVKIFSIIT